MGVVTVSSATTRTPLRLSARYLAPVSLFKKPIILPFKNDTSKNVALTAEQERVALRLEADKENEKSLRKVKQHPQRVNAVMTDESFPSTLDLDYNEAAAKLEYIYERSPETTISVEDVKNQRVMGRQPQRNRCEEVDVADKKIADNVVRSRRKKEKRLSLEKRIAIKMKKESEFLPPSSCQRKRQKDYNDENSEKLVREYSTSTVSLDWKKMKIPPVLPSSEHAWLFKLVQPMKEILQVKENLRNDLGREVADCELAAAIKMDTFELRKQLEVGRAARNKLIKHNLRLVLFVMNKHFQGFANGSRFQDLCQAGVNGLITAIDRFEPKRQFRLSTYSLYWIRHAITHSITVSSFTKVSFGLDKIRADIQRARLELMFELQRLPTEEEIVDRTGISLERYREVIRVSKPVSSLNARHAVTQEEFIHGVTDVDAVEGDKRRKPARLRLALDDVLDSLKPKESLVIRQRYGLDGKGNRTLGETAANLNISREMARKHEVKALMKLKHPARVNYLRHNIFN